MFFKNIQYQIRNDCYKKFKDKRMNKRKLDINQIKKTTLRGKKYKTVNTKYEIVLSYFKQKELKATETIFRTDFFPLISDILQQLLSSEPLYKLQNSISQPIKLFDFTTETLKLDSMFLRHLSNEYPIQEVLECVWVKKNNPGAITMGISYNKLMIFFKHLRRIYSEFCFCVGDKIIVENYDLKSLYQGFKCQWGKSEERGRMSHSQRLEKLICRSLYFFGIIIENNIFGEIEEQQRKKKQEATQPGTKSQKKRNVRGITHQVSSTYSFNSTDMLSNFSFGLYSQRSNEQEFMKAGHSEKSEKLPRKLPQAFNLIEKAEIGNLKIAIKRQEPSLSEANSTYEIDLLSNDVENILIETAFKIQKFKDACGRNQHYYPTGVVDHQFGGYQMYPNYFGYQFPEANQEELHQIRRSFGLSNLVETRKKPNRLGNSKYQ